jgi:hypothetical protein
MPPADYRRLRTALGRGLAAVECVPVRATIENMRVPDILNA